MKYSNCFTFYIIQILLLYYIKSDFIEDRLLLNYENKYINILSNNIKIKLNIEQANKNYIVIDFISTNGNLLAYISRINKNLNITQSQFKLSLNGDKNIILPKKYYKENSSKNLYIYIYCSNNCNFYIKSQEYEQIPIDENQLITFSGFDINQIYIFKYKYDSNIIVGKNIDKLIAINSNNGKDFNNIINYYDGNQIINIKIANKTWNTGNSFLFNSLDYKICNECYFLIEIKVLSSTAFINLEIIVKNYSFHLPLIFNKYTYGQLNINKTECYNFIEKIELNNNFYYLDFFISNILKSFYLISKDKKIFIDRSLTILLPFDNEGFCLIMDSNNNVINDKIYYSFISYVIKDNKNIASLSLVQNGYLVNKKLLNNEMIYFRPSKYEKNEDFNFYLNILEGDLLVKHIFCEEFPFCYYEKYPIENINNKMKDLMRLGNEYFGNIINRNLTSSEYYSKQNIFLIYCKSGREYKNLYNLCNFNLMFYTKEDGLLININDKFTLFNKKNNKHKILFNLIDKSDSYFIIDIYTHFGTSYTKLSSIGEKLENNFYYNGNLISTEISDLYNPNKLISFHFDYKFYIYNENYDLTSFLVTKRNNQNYYEEYLWLNQEILITLTNRIKNKKIIINNFPGIKIEDNFTEIIAQFNILNCQVDIELKSELNIINKYIHKNKNIYFILNGNYSKEFQLNFNLNLKNIFQNESVCMLYFSSYILNNNENLLENNILLNENIKNTFYLSLTSIQEVLYKYIVFDLNNYISIIMDLDNFIKIEVLININKKLYKTINLFFSDIIIITPEDLKNNCYFFNDLNICEIYVTISLKKNKLNQFNNKSQIGITIKSNFYNNLPVIYLNSNSIKEDIIINNKIQYYYNNIKEGESGLITLNNKKGNGILIARIVPYNLTENNKNWQNRIELPNKNNYHLFKDILQYDINTNQIKLTKNDTKKCIKKNRCQLIIGVLNNNDNKDDNNNYFEYSISFLKHNEGNSQIGIEINSFNSIQGVLYNLNKYLKYIYYIPENSKEILFDLDCIKCEIKFLYKNQELKIKNNKLILSNIEDLYNNYIEIIISSKELENIFYTKFYFNIYPIYKNQKFPFKLINYEFNSLCINECKFLIPLFKYKNIKEIIISISNKKGEKYKNSFQYSIESYYYKNFENFYLNNQENDYYYNKINLTENKNNYFIIKTIINEDSFYYIQIKLNDIDKNNIYKIDFTYIKESQNFILISNKKNIYHLNNEINYIKLPNNLLSNNLNNKINNSYVIFSHLNGIGYFELIKNNYFLFNSEHKNIILTYNNYKNDNYYKIYKLFEKDLFLNVNINMELNNNIYELIFGKNNYILLSNINSYPILFYIKLLNNIINYNITINLCLNFEYYNIFNFSVKGYVTNEKFINNKINNKNIPNEKIKKINSIYNIINNCSILIFNKKDINEFDIDNKILLLEINFEKENLIEDNIIIKVIALPNINNNYSIPQYEYFYSKIENDINIYKLSILNKNDSNLYLEFISNNYDEINYILKYNYDNINNISLKNENELNIIKEVNINRKKILFFKLLDNIKYLYIIIYFQKKNKIKNLNYFFAIKYYSFQNNIQNYFEINNKFLINKYLINNEIFLNWTKINKSNVNYYLIFYQKEKYENNNFNFLFNKNNIVINNNNFFVFNNNNIFNNYEINLIASFKEDKFIENLIYYEFYKNKSLKNSYKIKINYFYFFLIIICFIFIILYIYKIIRKLQVNNLYKLIINKKILNKNTNDEIIFELDKKFPQNLSFLIDTKED